MGRSQNTENEANLLLLLGTKSYKVFIFRGLSPDHLTRGSAPGSSWGLCPRPRYRLALRVLTMRVHPTFFDLATPLFLIKTSSHVSTNTSTRQPILHLHSRAALSGVGSRRGHRSPPLAISNEIFVGCNNGHLGGMEI